MSPRPSFSTTERARRFEYHGGICHFCEEKIDPTCERWELSHVVDYELTRDNSTENTRPGHYLCHRVYTNKVGNPAIAKAKRVYNHHNGFKRPKNPMPGSFASGWRKRMDGTVERR